MNEILEKARNFILLNARLLERRLFQVHFEGESSDCVGQIIRAYQNSDGGLGHALEPDIRCSESQPIFVWVGLSALEEAGCRDIPLAESLCNYLKSISVQNGLVGFLQETAYRSPFAGHYINSDLNTSPALNPTAGICGLLHYQGVQHDWLSLATENCCTMIINEPPLEAHTLFCVSQLVEYLPDRAMAMNLLDAIALALPKASFYIPDAPVNTYGLTPLHFAPRPDSICRALFTDEQIDSHLEDLAGQQQADGGWTTLFEAPGPASALEWRGRWTLDAICRLVAYDVIGN